MTEEQKSTESQSDDTGDESQPSPEPASASGEGYLPYLIGLFNRPDDFFDDKARGLKVFGLINMGALVVLIALSSFVQRIALTSTTGVRFSWLVNGIKFGLSFAIPIAVVLFLLAWWSRRESQNRSVDFFMEKFGGAVALPAVLVTLAIPLNLLGITMHSWFRGAGLFFIYIAVFMMSYLYAAPGKLKVAVVFTLGFYFAYRLIWLLM